MTTIDNVDNDNDDAEIVTNLEREQEFNFYFDLQILSVWPCPLS